MIENETQVTKYPELEEEAEPAPVEDDDKPVSTNAKDWTVGVLYDKYKRGKVDLQPEYQREYVWQSRPELPSRLIESLLLDIPIPPIYFAKMPGEKLEVIDGQQRLTTLANFLDDKFALQKLQRIGSLIGKKYTELSDEQQEKIRDAQIRSIIVDTGANSNLRYEVFERLNRGSMALNEQELRNCVYRGDFCDLLATLERETSWRKVKGGAQPEARFKEREMILRFFAFSSRVGFYKGNLKRFLSDYMASHAPKDGEIAKLDEQAEMFRLTMRNIYTVFGEHSARLYTVNEISNQGRWDADFSVSVLDIQSSALQGHDNAHVQAAAEQIREAYLFYLLTNSDVREAISRQPAGTNATKTRWIGFKAEVQKLLNSTQIEPRFFPYSFRKQLFEADSTCKLCSNAINSFDDCAVDHIIPYSKGGKTEESNAQLAHRSCNSRKCANVI